MFWLIQHPKICHCHRLHEPGTTNYECCCYHGRSSSTGSLSLYARVLCRLTSTYFSRMRPFSFFPPSQRGATDLRLGRDLRTLSLSPPLATLFVYSHTELVMRAQALLLLLLLLPCNLPTTSLPPLPDGPTPSLPPPPLSLSSFIYIFIYFAPALRVTVFNIIGETWLLPLNAEITGAFFLSSSPLHFSRVAPRGRNIFISPCAPSFKTFTPAVWKIFLIFLPHGVEKSP